MILPHTYGVALFLMIASMLCWGSWANTYKLAGKWRFELYYFDYALGLMLAAIIYALTTGNLGYDGFSFMDDLLNAGKRQWLFGFTGGVVFNFANMLLTAAIAVAGMSVAFPVGIGLALVVGVILNYIVSPTGNPAFLFGGVVLVVGAILVDAMAYRYLGFIRHEEMARAGKVPTRRRSSMKGIVLALVSGFLMGTFYPLVAKAQAGEIGLGPYAVGVVFAAGVFCSTFVFNLFFMNLPVEGEPVEVLDYFKGRPSKHLLGLAGGAIWFTGAIASFVAASPKSDIHVGPAISYAMGQGATLISALWGLIIWKEFRGADTRIKSLLALMLILFAAGLTLVSLAPLFVEQ
jgi:glucose uptake protein